MRTWCKQKRARQRSGAWPPAPAGGGRLAALHPKRRIRPRFDHSSSIITCAKGSRTWVWHRPRGRSAVLHAQAGAVGAA
eukprot:scaffold14825_cov123-Isochrysis_galbana.AAC.8